jgi:hypothetical protein
MLNLGALLFAATAILLMLAVARKRRAHRDAAVAAAVAEVALESADPVFGDEEVDPLRGRTRGAPVRVTAARAAERRAAEDLLARRRQLTALVMSIIVSVCALGGSLYLILSKSYGSEAEKWAFGTVGTILGYWLNSKS